MTNLNREKPNFPKSAHNITPIFENGKLTGYRVISPGGQEFEVDPNHPGIKAILDKVFAEAQNNIQMMGPIDFASHVVEVLKANKFAEEFIPKSPEDALGLANSLLTLYNQLEAKKLKL